MVVCVRGTELGDAQTVPRTPEVDQTAAEQADARRPRAVTPVVRAKIRPRVESLVIMLFPSGSSGIGTGSTNVDRVLSTYVLYYHPRLISIVTLTYVYLLTKLTNMQNKVS